MTDFETNLRSVEIAVRTKLPENLRGWAKLEPNGVLINITNDEIDTKTVKYIVAWHEFASWRAPQGALIVQRMVNSINKPGKTKP